MAIDLMNTITKKQETKKVILIASDSDFVPIVNQLKSEGIEVILYTYYIRKRNTGLSRSNHLLNSVSRYSKMNKSDFNFPLK